MQTRSRTTLSRTLSVSATLILRLGLLAISLGVILEMTARVVIFGPKGLDPRRVGIFQDLAPSELVTFDTERDILFQYKPNQDRFFKMVHFRTNSRGLRDKEYSLVKPPNTYRVAVMGSSFTLPAGVEIEDAFHSLLEKRLSTEFAPTSYEFINFAVGLHGPNQIVAMLLHRALEYAPDLITVSATAMAVPGFFQDWDALPPPNMLRLVDPQGPRSYFIRLVKSRLKIERLPFGLDPPAFPPLKPKGQDVISKLGEISRETGIPIVVVRIELDSKEPSPVERALERRVLAEGMFYLDTRSAFRGMNPSDFWIYELDPHPNRYAHAIFADSIENFLRAHDLLGR